MVIVSTLYSKFILYKKNNDCYNELIEKGIIMKKLTFTLITILLLTAVIFVPVTANAADISMAQVSADTDYIIPEESNLPESYSSLELGYCTEVKTQTQNACWIYSTISSIESCFLRNNIFSEILDFSETHLDIWGSKRENGQGWQREPFDPGYTDIPIGYLTSWNGPVYEDNTETNFRVNSLVYLTKNDMNKTKELIMKNGAVTANFNTHSFAYSKDRCSYCLTDPISEISGHTISVVGWDDNYSKENFNGNYMPKNNGAWLCKNSWGNNNDIGGYLWISYEDYYLFSNDFFGYSFGIDGYQFIEENDYLYQNEEYGATYEFGYIDSDVITYYNVFDFSENGNRLDKVIFETTSKGADYKVYYVPVDELGKPVDDAEKRIDLYEGTVDYRGYICCDFDDVTLSQDKGAIAVEIDTTSVNQNLAIDETPVENSIGVSEWLRNRESGNIIFQQQGEYGKSFVNYNGEITDVMDFYNNEFNDPIGGMLVIKALTNKKVNTKTLGDVNFDENVDINDATMIQKYINNSFTNLMNDQLINADFNKDGVININDVTAIQKYILK